MLAPRRKLWLVYKRLRVSIGLFGFILMYGSLTNSISFPLLSAGFGLAFIELFGALYNDYTDYEEDLRNNRTEKLTVSGFVPPENAKVFSFMSVFSGLAILLSVNVYFFLLGIYYSVFLYLYSNPKIFLKRYNIFGYLAVESFWLVLPLYMGIIYLGPPDYFTFAFAFFVFSQYVYILSQKDSTDPHDRTNLFLARGWKKASIICAAFAFLSSAFLLVLSAASFLLMAFWFVNASIKVANVSHIYRKKINRKIRGRLILMEFLTPYMYSAGILV